MLSVFRADPHFGAMAPGSAVIELLFVRGGSWR